MTISFVLNSRGWLQNVLKHAVFHPLVLPELCAHLSYVIFLSICGFEVMAVEMLTLQVKFRAKTRFFSEEMTAFLLLPHSCKTWKWVHSNWFILLIRRCLSEVMYSWKMLCDSVGWIVQTNTNFPTNICLCYINLLVSAQGSPEFIFHKYPYNSSLAGIPREYTRGNIWGSCFRRSFLGQRPWTTAPSFPFLLPFPFFSFLFPLRRPRPCCSRLQLEFSWQFIYSWGEGNSVVLSSWISLHIPCSNHKAVWARLVHTGLGASPLFPVVQWTLHCRAWDLKVWLHLDAE